MKKKNIIIAIILVIVIIAAIILTAAGVKSSNEKRLETALSENWVRSEEDGALSYDLYLKFSGGSVKYIFSSDVKEQVLAELNYENLGGGKVRFTSEKVDKTVKITISSDGSEMKMTPALTKDEESEVWYIQEEA